MVYYSVLKLSLHKCKPTGPPKWFAFMEFCSLLHLWNCFFNAMKYRGTRNCFVFMELLHLGGLHLWRLDCNSYNVQHWYSRVRLIVYYFFAIFISVSVFCTLCFKDCF